MSVGFSDERYEQILSRDDSMLLSHVKSNYRRLYGVEIMAGDDDDVTFSHQSKIVIPKAVCSVFGKRIYDRIIPGSDDRKESRKRKRS